MHLPRIILPVLVLTALVSAVFAQDIRVIPHVYGDIPNSEFSYYTGPDYVGFMDGKLSVPTGYANRHDWRLTNPDGTDIQLGTFDYFMLEADVTAYGPAPVECGLTILGNGWSDGHVTVHTNGGHGFGWGGIMPWWYAGAGLFTYGQTTHLGILYTNEGGMNGVHYYIGNLDSGFIPMYNLEQGILPPTVIGGYFQPLNDPNNPDNQGSVLFSNIRYNGSPINATSIPEPGALTLLGTSLLGLLALRRRH